MSVPFANAYSILQLEPGATSEEMKSAIIAHGLLHQPGKTTDSVASKDKVTLVYELWLSVWLEEVESGLADDELQQSDGESGTILEGEEGLLHSPGLEEGEIQADNSFDSSVDMTQNVESQACKSPRSVGELPGRATNMSRIPVRESYNKDNELDTTTTDGGVEGKMSAHKETRAYGTTKKDEVYARNNSQPADRSANGRTKAGIPRGRGLPSPTSASSRVRRETKGGQAKPRESSRPRIYEADILKQSYASDAMDAHRLSEIGQTILHELESVSGDIKAISSNVRKLLPEAKFWRWQIEALPPLALKATRQRARHVAGVALTDDQETVARAYIRGLQFVEKARETVAACEGVIAERNSRAPWTMACCEELHELLCAFPEIAVPEDLRHIRADTEAGDAGSA